LKELGPLAFDAQLDLAADNNEHWGLSIMSTLAWRPKQRSRQKKRLVATGCSFHALSTPKANLNQAKEANIGTF
jgi:hypothetical protein